MGNRSHSLAADRLLQGCNRGRIAPKWVFLDLLLPGSAVARKDILERDMNEDGLIDQIAHFDKKENRK